MYNVYYISMIKIKCYCVYGIYCDNILQWHILKHAIIILINT